MADQIIAMRIRFEDKGLVPNMANYLTATGAVGGQKPQSQRIIQRYGDAIERQLGVLYEMSAGGPELRGVPDLLEPSARMARAMGLITQDEFEASEVKAKQKLVTHTGGTTIGQFAPFAIDDPAAPSLTKAIREQAGIRGTEGAETAIPEGLDINDPAAVLKAARKSFGKTGARGFFNMIKENDPKMHMTFFHKVKNLTITKGVVDKKGKVVAADVFQIHFPLAKFTSPPFTTELKGKSIVYVLESAFEKDLIENLENAKPAILAKNVEEFQKGLAKLPKQAIVSKEKTMSGVDVGYGMIFGVPAGGSIQVLRVQLKKGATSKRQPRRQTRGQFISNVQLSAILQKRLTQVQPRYKEPQRPTPRYITGRLARSFQIMANYRQGIIGFFNTPPASGYQDKLNENGWMLDETLVEPTIRQITQQLFGRQFRVLRTQ